MKRIPKPLLIMLPMGAAMLSLPSCNGIFEGIYDEPVADTEFGFTKVEQATSSGTIYIDATSYTKWTYIDFETFSIDTTVIAEDGTETGEVMEGWDLAIHRYDTKTNGGAVIETVVRSSKRSSPRWRSSWHRAGFRAESMWRISGPRTG